MAAQGVHGPAGCGVVPTSARSAVPGAGRPASCSRRASPGWVPVRLAVVRLAVVLLAVLAAVSVSACRDGGDGGGGGDAAGPAAPATSEGLEASVAAFGAALFEGDDAAAYAALSAACRQRWTEEEWAARSAAIRASVPGDAGSDEPVRVAEVRTRNVTATEAEAATELVTPGGVPTGPDPDTSWARWVYEDGRWRLDDCPRLGSGTLAPPLGEPVTPPER